ncbi:MAG: ISAon1 family transposase N-terminal region protein [Candidatus Saccharimonadales bacterium]
MGKKSKEPPKDPFFEMSRMMVPQDILDYFDVIEVKELHSEWQIMPHEKQGLIPQALQGLTNMVLDGYCNPHQILSHCFSLKPVYLILKRRRWKQAGTDIHYSNEYKITDNPAKLTPAMAGFLKI